MGKMQVKNKCFINEKFITLLSDSFPIGVYFGVHGFSKAPLLSMHLFLCYKKKREKMEKTYKIRFLCFRCKNLCIVNLRKFKRQNFLEQEAAFQYRMRAIITRCLYTFYPLFEVQKRFIRGFFLKILALCMVSIQEWFLIKSGL